MKAVVATYPSGNGDPLTGLLFENEDGRALIVLVEEPFVLLNDQLPKEMCIFEGAPLISLPDDVVEIVRMMVILGGSLTRTVRSYSPQLFLDAFEISRA